MAASVAFYPTVRRTRVTLKYARTCLAVRTYIRGWNNRVNNIAYRTAVNTTRQRDLQIYFLVKTPVSLYYLLLLLLILLIYYYYH